MSAVTVAASDDDFYQRLYQRGMTHFAAGDYAAAFTELRSAAFGFVERVEQFEIAQSYACIAAHRLGHVSDARDSLIRIVGAEKVQPRYRSLKLPDDVRAEVNGIAASLLTEQEAALLGIGAVAKPAVDVPAVRDREPEASPAVKDPKPQPVTPAPVPQPKKPIPQPTSPAPQSKKPIPQPVPAPQPKKPIPQPVPAPQPKSPAPQPVVPASQPAPAPQPAAGNADSGLADAQRAIESGDIDRARSIYNDLSTAPSLSHTVALRVAEGLYRVRDFPGAARTFARAGAIGRGEEGYHYYYAVALYETGSYGNAKRELAAALPYIAVTPDVTRYRAKIEGAIE